LIRRPGRRPLSGTAREGCRPETDLDGETGRATEEGEIDRGRAEHGGNTGQVEPGAPAPANPAAKLREGLSAAPREEVLPEQGAAVELRDGVRTGTLGDRNNHPSRNFTMLERRAGEMILD
jgi:hypothetical protein